MLTLEQYASIYLTMISAAGNAQQEQEICSSHGYTLAQWQEAKDFYTAKMMDPNDMGKTAMAFSAAMMQGATPVQPQQQQQTLTPSDFTANNIQIYISEFDVQMVEFLNRQTQQHIVLQLGFDAKDDFEKKYINGRVHISINDQSYSIYGGVEKVELSSTAVKFIFDEEGKARMQCGSITVLYNINGKLYNYLKRKMQFMYKNILSIKEESTPKEYVVNGITLNDEWGTFSTDSMKVSIRPNLQNIKETGKYPQAVFVDFMSATIGKDNNEMALLNEVEACLKDTLEYDLAAVMLFHVTDNEKRRFFIYTGLSQKDFMTRINEAFRLLPQLPLNFSGGEDAVWANYAGCLGDYNLYK
ncbi:MAG TPA: Imm10 family immunity protein [Chitinophagales bacterium]|nr:Imm10 family immunity protein [Chitinophagales bacterium]